LYPTLSLLTAAFAASGNPVPDSDAGFDYSTKLRTGVVAIEGHRSDCGSPFSLRVDANGRVKGEVAGTPVRFWVSAAAHRRLASGLTA
jgi:hypothetical protein